MKGACGILLSLLAVRLVGCAESQPPAELPANPSTLKDRLDWIYGFSKAYPTSTNKPQLDNLITAHGISKEFSDIETTISSTISGLVELRKVILTSEGEETQFKNPFTNKSYESQLNVLINIIPSVYNKLTYLSTNIGGWIEQKSGVDGSTMTIKVNMGESAKWFKQQGFKDTELSSTTLLTDAKAKLDAVYGQDKPLNKFASFIGTLYSLAPGDSLGDRLTWLLMFGKSVSTNETLSTKLKDRVNAVVSGKGDELVLKARELTQDGGPLMTMFGTEDAKQLYPSRMSYLNIVKFVDGKSERYLSILSETYTSVNLQLRVLEDNLRTLGSGTDAGIEAKYRSDFGFVVTSLTSKHSELAEKVKKVREQDGPFSKIGDILHLYENKGTSKSRRSKDSRRGGESDPASHEQDDASSDGMHAASISPVALAVLVMSAFAMVA